MAGASALSPVSLTSFYDPYDGSVLLAETYFYKAGTLDPVAVYTDASLSIPHGQPVKTSGSGRIPPVWIGEIGPYRARSFDQYGQLLEDIDNLPPAPPPSEVVDPPEPVNPDTLLKTGEMFMAFSNAAQRSGAVRCNGLTIGSVTSGATERANADCEALFKHLWQQDAGNMLKVLPAKGASSDGDWTANKQMSLPDMKGRQPTGMENMGSGFDSGRLAGAYFTTDNGLDTGTVIGGSAAMVGANGGRASMTLTIEKVPSHNHTLTDPGHNHVLTDAWHGHGVTDPTHTHDMRLSQDTGGSTGGAALRAGSGGAIVAGASVRYMATGISINTGPANISIAAVASGVSIAAAGGGQAFSLEDPFLLLTFYIKL
jgi:microcystin-dependent protein